MKILFYNNRLTNQYEDGDKIVVSDRKQGVEITYRSLEGLRDYWKTIDCGLNSAKHHMDELDLGIIEMLANQHNACYFSDFMRAFKTTSKEEVYTFDVTARGP